MESQAHPKSPFSEWKCRHRNRKRNSPIHYTSLGSKIKKKDLVAVEAEAVVVFWFPWFKNQAFHDKLSEDSEWSGFPRPRHNAGYWGWEKEKKKTIDLCDQNEK